MIQIEITKSEILFGIGVSHKLLKYGFTQFAGQINVHRSQIIESVIVECYPTLKDLLTMSFDEIREELRR